MNNQTKRALRYLASHQHTLQTLLIDGNGDDLERTLESISFWALEAIWALDAIEALPPQEEP